MPTPGTSTVGVLAAGLPALTAAGRRSLARHPGWPLLVVAAAGWGALVRLLWWPAGTGTAAAPGRVGSHGAHGIGTLDPAAPWTDSWFTPAVLAPASATTDVWSAAGAATVHWWLMVVAMMLPGVLAPLRYTALASVRWRRRRAMGMFLLGYLSLWGALGAVVALVQVLGPRPGVMTVAGLLVLASAWELTPVVQHALARCHRTLPIRVEGWAADRSAVRFGAFHARACLLTCGPLMVVVSLAGHPLVLTLGVVAVTWLQKAARSPQAWTHAVAVLGTLSALVLVGTG